MGEERQMSQITTRSAEPLPAVLAAPFHVAPILWDANRIGAWGLHRSLSLFPSLQKVSAFGTGKGSDPAPHIHISVFPPSSG